METTIKDVINYLSKSVGKVKDSVDKLETGDVNSVITGIGVSFVPSVKVIKEMKKRNANLLVTHEGLYFAHRYDSIHQTNKIAKLKEKLIRENELAIYRNHDDIHRHQPDGIMEGLINELQWDRYLVKHYPAAAIVTIPEATLEEIGRHIKEKLMLPRLRIVGNKNISCSKVGILVGYRGSAASVISLMEKDNVDLVIYGEGPEWEAPQYVHDSIALNLEKSLIVLGHEESEAPGMIWLVEKLKKQFPYVPVDFIANNRTFEDL